MPTGTAGRSAHLASPRGLDYVAEIARPPTGIPVRRLIGLVALGIGLPRFFVIALFAPLHYVSPFVYALSFTLLGVALLATCYNGYRFTVAGRAVAAFGMALFLLLAIDSADSSHTSLAVNLALAYALFGETLTTKGECE